jgi:serine/threonine protein kinase/lipopolysaccharide biosynthesis regulator YciM
VSKRPSDELPSPHHSNTSGLTPGQLLASRYRVVRLLGSGGMGEVYEVRDELIHEAVALKTLRRDLVAHRSGAARFESEMRLARKVAHPCVCRVFEVGAHELAGEPPLRFITMELLHGESLSSRIRRLGRLTKEQAFPLAIQMAEGLQAAHELGIVHGDFKSSNVLIVAGPDGDHARITDFGLARIDPGFQPADETRTIHDGGKLVGTVGYMSPEQMGGGEITRASDLYSFGIVLFEMATGQLPFDKSHVIHAAMQRASGEGTRARSLAPNLDRRWEAAIVRCMQRDRTQRGSAAELADWFRGGQKQAKARWNRRKWLVAGGAAAACLGGFSGYWLWSHTPYTPKPESLDWYLKGVNGLNSTTYEAARKALRQAVAKDPQFALAYAGLAQANQELDYTEVAKESMLKALTVAQETRLSSADQRRLRAYQLIVSRDYERAAPLLQEMEGEASAAERPAAALESGWLAEQQGNTDEAARAYGRALKLDPAYAPAKLRLGQILQRRRELPAALADFQEAERLFTASSEYEGVTEALWGQANLLIRSSRASDALPLIEKALADSRTVDNPYLQIRLELLRGVAFRYLGQYQRAEEIASQAIGAADEQHMDNLASSARIDLGNSYMERGDVKAAEQYYLRALTLAHRGQLSATEARAQFSLASYCEQANRPEEAMQYIEPALQFYKKGGYRREVIQATTILGGVYSRQARYDDSVKALRGVLPDAAQLGDATIEERVRERIAEALRHQGNWPTALDETGKALALLKAADTVDIQLSKTWLLWKLGRRADSALALAEIERLLLQSPDPASSLELALLKSEMAYDDGHMQQTADLAQRSLGTKDPGTGARSGASLRLGVALIRMHREEGLPLASGAVDYFDRTHMAAEATQARLSLGEALVAAGRAGEAGEYATQALLFLEPRGIAEACWRAHLVAGAAGTPQEREKHRQAALSAFAKLRAVWPAPDVATYMARPEIKTALEKL